MKQTEISSKWVEAKTAGNESLTAILAALGESQTELKSTKRRLLAAAGSGIMRLERLVEMTEDYDEDSDGQPPIYNEMGTLQGLGSDIDRLTGEMALQVKMFATLDKLVRGIEKQKESVTQESMTQIEQAK